MWGASASGTRLLSHLVDRSTIDRMFKDVRWAQEQMAGARAFISAKLMGLLLNEKDARDCKRGSTFASAMTDGFFRPAS